MTSLETISGAIQAIEMAYVLLGKGAITSTQYEHVRLALLNEITPYVMDALKVIQPMSDKAYIEDFTRKAFQSAVDAG